MKIHDLMLAETQHPNVDVRNAEVSLKEELTAIASYEKRLQETTDPELAKILAHNRDEEKVHAAKLRHWLASQG